MSITYQFWQYGAAMLSADEAKTDEDRQSFLDLAHFGREAPVMGNVETFVRYSLRVARVVYVTNITNRAGL